MATQLVDVGATRLPLPDITQDEQWKEARRHKLGGSDAGSVFNVGYGCARKLAYQKLGYPEDFPFTEQQQRILRRGNMMEELVADEYAFETGRKVRKQKMATSKEFDFMAVNIDRQILNDERGPGVLECKTANPWIFDKFQNEGLAEEYALQLQHSLIVKGYKWGAFAVMNAANWQMLIFERDLNTELAPIIIEKEKEFWGMVQAGILPEPLPKANDKRCASCLFRKTCRGQAQIIPDAGDSGYVADEGLSELADDYIVLLNKKTSVDAAVDDCKEQLKQACGDRQHISIPSICKRIRYAWQKGRTTTDSKGLQALTDNLVRKAPGNPELEQVLMTLQACKKIAQPTRAFYFEEANDF